MGRFLLPLLQGLLLLFTLLTTLASAGEYPIACVQSEGVQIIYKYTQICHQLSLLITEDEVGVVRDSVVMHIKVHSQIPALFNETLIDKCVSNEERSGESSDKGDKDKCRYKRGEACTKQGMR